MDIVHVVDSLEIGGAEVLVAKLCRLQKDAGHGVGVACLFKRGPLAEDLEKAGIPVFVTAAASTPGKMFRLWREFLRRRPDVVHCHNAMAAIAGARAGRAAGARVFATRHGLVAPETAKPVQERRFWRAARFCRAVIAVCDATAINLRRQAGALADRIVTIRNGASRAAAGERVATEGLTVVTVARLNREKDQATLLRGFSEAAHDVPDLRLWIVGDGPLGGDLRGLAESLGLAGRVRFWGMQKQVGSWLGAADLFVLSSISEGLPVSLLEALAAGLPPICTDVGGMPEVVRLAGCGVVIPPSSPAALADALRELARDREALARQKQAARESYERHFTIEQMADAHLRLYTGAAL